VLGLRDRHPDAGEARLGGLAEPLVLLLVEVGREAVVEPLDHAPDRVVGQLVAVDLAVEVVLDAADRLLDVRDVVVGDELPERVGEDAAVPAEPHAREEQDEDEQDGWKRPQDHGAAG
jgi:hypothetical protein